MAMKRVIKKKYTPVAAKKKPFKARQEDELEDALDDLRDASRSINSARRNVRRAIRELDND